MREPDDGNRPCSSHALDLLGQDLHGDTNLTRPAMRVAFLTGVLLGERVDVCVGPLFGDLDDSTADLEIAVGVVGVLDRERDLRIALQIFVLHPSPGGIEQDVRAVVVDPHWRHLRRAVAADGRDVRERLLRQEITIGLWNRCHGHLPLALSCSNTENAWRTDFTASVPPIRTPMSRVSAISFFPRSPNAAYTFIGDLSIRPFKRFRSASRS